ncbi:MAG TPA: LacI family transcriptional regulator [Actinobacteria bacterium]|jgi:LacI family transcriptional regulator|nr:LacI family transcriptional regulator [Actinomycetota bacterium]
MVTIKDIARKSGVSVGTVSNVINNLESVKSKNKEKVLQVINSLGYKPNKIAASLSRKKTMNVGLIVPDVSSPFYSDLIKGISDTLEINYYNIFLCSSNNNIEKEEKIISDLLSMWIDGIILIPVYSKKRNLQLLKNIEIPVVIVNREVEGIKKDIVIFDNFGGAFEATRFLIANNHKIIPILSGPELSKSFEERFQGWKAAMEESDLFNDNLIFRGNFSVEAGHRMMLEVLNRIDKIDAVFASSDLIALGALSAIDEYNLKVPDDISVVGFGDIYLSKFLKPSLTTIRRPFYNIGKTAVSLLLDRISGNKKKKITKFIIKGKLEIRDSVKISELSE